MLRFHILRRFHLRSVTIAIAGLLMLFFFSMVGFGVVLTAQDGDAPLDGIRGLTLPDTRDDGTTVELPTAGGTELLKNRGIETGATHKPQNAKQWPWAGKRAGGDRRICNTATVTTIAFAGKCALQFSSGAGLMRSVHQKRTLPTPLGKKNDTLTLKLAASTKNMSAKLMVTVKVKYTSGATETFKLKLPPVAGDQPYAEFGKQFTLDGKMLNYDIKLATAAKGRVRIDALSLVHAPPPPETPPSFVSSSPANGEVDVAWDSPISLTFDEPVYVGGAWYMLECPMATAGLGFHITGDGTDTITLTHTSNQLFDVGDTCAMTIFPDGVTDVDADDPPDTMVDEVNFSFTVLATPPTATADSYNVAPNVGLSVPAVSGYLLNDTLARGTLISPQLNTPIATAQGGTVTLLVDGGGKPTGAFTYEPPRGKHGIADSFIYTLQNPVAQSSATVTLNLLEQPSVWFINAAAPQNGIGTLASPFIDIASYNGFAGGATVRTGDIVYVYSGAYSGSGFVLKNGQAVYGQAVDLNTVMTWLPAHSNPLPSTGARPSISTFVGSGVLLAQNNTLRGFNIGDTANTAISGGSVGTLTISDLGVTTTSGVLKVTAGGTLNAALDAITGIGTDIDPAIKLVNTGGTLTVADGFLSNLNGDVFVVSGGAPTITYHGDLTTVGSGWLLRVENTTDGEITLRDGTLGAVAHGVSATNAAHVRLRDLTLERINPIIDEFMGRLATRYNNFGSFDLGDIADLAASTITANVGIDAPMAGDPNGVEAINSQVTLRDMTLRDFAANGVSADNSVLTLNNAELLDNDLAALFIISQAGDAALDMIDSTIFTVDGAGVTVLVGDGGGVCLHLQNNEISAGSAQWGMWLQTMAADAQIALRNYTGTGNNTGQITTFVQAANAVTPSVNVIPTSGSIGSNPLCDSGGGGAGEGGD